MSEEKYGFVYIWYDVRDKRYYVGCHWGNVHDGYICSSNWMRNTYNRRPQDFRRRILKTNLTREDMYAEEHRYFNMIKPHEIKHRYYNLCLTHDAPWHADQNKSSTIGQKISAKKKGKKTGPRPEVGPAISAAKKGKALTEEHKAALRGIKKAPHTDEWKKQNSERMTKLWAERRKQREPKKILTRDEQSELCSKQLKNRWADPIWAANQRERLKAGSAKRYGKVSTELNIS